MGDQLLLTEYTGGKVGDQLLLTEYTGGKVGDQLLLTEYTGGNHGKLTANEGKEPLKYYRALGGIRKNLMSHNQNPPTSLHPLLHYYP